MANKRIPIRARLASVIAGRQRALIPGLNPTGDGVIYPGASGVNSYSDKASQIGALTGWVFAANSAIVEPTAAVELVLKRRKKNGDLEDVTDGADHEILDLIDSPNFVHTGEQMRQLHFTYMNIVGESYILMRGLDGEPFVPSKGKLPAALDIFPAHAVTFELGATYTQSVVKIGKDECPITSFIRDLNPDPSNPYSGRSVVAASAAAIGLDEQMKEWNQSPAKTSSKSDLTAIREWASANGYEVSSRGRIAGNVVSAYEASH